MSSYFRYALTALLCSVVFGCYQSQVTTSTPSPTAVDSAAPRGDQHHHHEPPHGGTLIVLGDEFAHLEFLLDPATGTLTVYVLDGEAENTVRLPGSVLTLVLEGGEAVSLSPVANELTGETESDSATYRGVVEGLKGREAFQGVLKELNVKGSQFQDVVINFPGGNEGEHEKHEH